MEPSAFASVFENEEWLGSELNLAEGHGGPSSGPVVEQNGTQAKQLSKNSMKLFVDPSNMGKNQEDEVNLAVIRIWKGLAPRIAPKRRVLQRGGGVQLTDDVKEIEF